MDAKSVTAPKSLKRRAPNEEVTGGFVDLDNAQRKVWLVKLPPFLAEAWEKQGPNVRVGSVRIKEERGKPPEMSVLLSGEYANQLPKEFAMHYFPEPSPLTIFSENVEEGGTIAAEGDVEYKCDVKPVFSEEYREMTRNRVQLANTKTRTLQRVDDKNLLLPVRGGMLYKKRKEDKRERVDKHELLDRIFKAFEKATYYDVKTLVEITDQPLQWLREGLTEVCIYNAKGPHKGTFELQPRYRNVKSNSNGNLMNPT